jgi:hypothetical protein
MIQGLHKNIPFSDASPFYETRITIRSKRAFSFLNNRPYHHGSACFIPCYFRVEEGILWKEGAGFLSARLFFCLVPVP